MGTRMYQKLVGAVGACAVYLALSSPAFAFTSTEGYVVGDQNFYWNHPGAVWLFPQYLANIDNRLAFQWAGTGTTLTHPWNSDYFGYAESPNASSGTNLPDTFNATPQQLSRGAGFSLEAADNLHVGAWLSEYELDTGGFVLRGINTMNWVGDSGDAVNDLIAFQGGFDPVMDPTTAGSFGIAGGDYFEPGDLPVMQKLDLFGAYNLEAMDMLLGVHLWGGSNHVRFAPDDAEGPIDVDSDNDPATPAAPTFLPGSDDQLDVGEWKYATSEYGLGVGGTYGGIQDLSIDAGLDFSMISVNWTPNGEEIADIGGSSFGFNGRAHYQLNDKWTVGGFFQFARRGMSMEPKTHRAGMQLNDLYDENATPPDALPDPALGTTPIQQDPALPGRANPVAGMKYEENQGSIQVAGLAKFTPNSRATFYSAFGWGMHSQNRKLTVSDLTFEQKASLNALPFIHMGAQVKAFKYLDFMLGATKRFTAQSQTVEATDNRIPDDGGFIGGGAAPLGNEDRTNENRRSLTTERGRDASFTNFTVGTRLHWDGWQLVGQLDPDVLRGNVHFLSGPTGAGTGPGAPWLWVSMIYDWDFDTDTEMGNGTQMYNPHEASKRKAPAAAPSASDEVLEG